MAYKSEIFEVLHQSATAKFEIGAISAARMREYDEACLVREPKTAPEAEMPSKAQKTGVTPAYAGQRRA